jgi:hypothetical protein
MSRSFSLGSKIAAAVSVFALGYAVTVTLGTIGDLQQEDKLNLLANEAVPGALELREARFVFDAAVQSHQNAMLTGDAETLAAVRVAAARTAELLKVSEAHHVALGAGTDEVRAAAAALGAFTEQAEPVFAAVSAKGAADPEVQKRIAEFNEIVARTVKALHELEQKSVLGLTDDLKAMKDESGRQRQLSFLVFGASLLLGGAAAFLISRYQVIRPVLTLSASLGEETEGVRSASAQFEQASVSLATGASSSAAALETSSAALEEISSVTSANADRAEQARGLSGRARDAAEAGTAGMAQLSEATVSGCPHK